MTEIITQPGIYVMNNESYHADPCILPSLSRGTIHDLIYKTPAHVYANSKRLNPRYIEQSRDESKFDKGTAAHSLFLEGYNIVEVIIADDWRTKDAKVKRDEARANGKIPMLEYQFDATREMVDAAHRQLYESDLGIKDLYSEGDSEVSLFWREKLNIQVFMPGEVSEIWCRCRLDWIRKNYGLILDYKTTGCAAANEFLRKIIPMGYDIQRSFYRRGAKAIAGKSPKWVFMVQEDERPYLCSFVDLDAAFVDMGNQKVETGIEMWAKSLAFNHWPGYSKEVCKLECSPWAMSQWEDKVLTVGVE